MNAKKPPVPQAQKTARKYKHQIARERKAASDAELFKQLSAMREPHVIFIVPPVLEGRDATREIMMARESNGTEHFFTRKDKSVSSMRRKDALALIIVATIPLCLKDDTLAMLKKNRMWR